jgi:hypothetical protein
MTGERLSLRECVDRIVIEHERLRDDWQHPEGWAPDGTAAKIRKADLDRMVSLAHCLRRWLKRPTSEEEHGFLVLAWANLGSLIEGYLTFFLALHYTSYLNDPVKDARQKSVRPEDLRFAQLTGYFRKVVWTERQAKRFHAMTERARGSRNAIHPFVKCEKGSVRDFTRALRQYWHLLEDMSGQHPEAPPVPDAYY